ncbi:MAG: hypothetical protein R2749_04020 [Acidimicrobiales bacterium]
MAAFDRAELDDDCELATFTALQRAGEYLEIAARLLDDAGSSPDLARRRRILHRRVDSFWCSTPRAWPAGLGLGDRSVPQGPRRTRRHALASPRRLDGAPRFRRRRGPPGRSARTRADAGRQGPPGPDEEDPP